MSDVKSSIFSSYSTLCFWVSGAPLGMGLYKMFIYGNDEQSKSYVNVYVGGDAYNYIINSNLATAYFVLFGAFFIGGVILAVADALLKHKQEPTAP